jgi:hypothetical protein
LCRRDHCKNVSRPAPTACRWESERAGALTQRRCSRVSRKYPAQGGRGLRRAPWAGPMCVNGVSFLPQHPRQVYREFGSRPVGAMPRITGESAQVRKRESERWEPLQKEKGKADFFLQKAAKVTKVSRHRMVRRHDSHQFSILATRLVARCPQIADAARTKAPNVAALGNPRS